MASHSSGRRPEPGPEAEMRRISRRSLLWSAAAIAAGCGGWHWITSQYADDGIPWPLRTALRVDEGFSRELFRSARLAPEHGIARAREPRPNGDEGLSSDFDPTAWRLRLMGLADMSGAVPSGAAASLAQAPPATDKKAPKHPGSRPPSDAGSQGQDDTAGSDDNGDGGDSSDTGATTQPDMTMPDEPAMELMLKDIMALPKRDMVTELKCIEGWSTVVHWTGARLADLIAVHPPITKSGNPPNVAHKPEDLADYVSLVTPDGGYYVGLDMASALHPQTLLCYAMNGAPLADEHGAPLRLVIPVKYGIKSIKRIGLIRYTNRRPADYWAEQGYDWYAGH